MRLSKVRSFYAFWNRWLVPVWNKVDKDRIKEIGADRAAAEWLLKNGAALQWKGQQRILQDYNSIPLTAGAWYIEGIFATDSSIAGMGFGYLDGLKHVKHIEFARCEEIGDHALHRLSKLKETLEFLRISECHTVTDNGLLSLVELRKLKELKLSKLGGVKRVEETISQLQGQMRSCNISYTNE